jgi:hypothetical protein
MIVILGLIIFVAAVVVAVAGVFGNGGAHGLDHGFSVLGYHVTGSGTVFLCGIVVGAVALFGLWLLLAGARRTSRRGSAARRGLKQSRRETAQSRQETAAVAKDRDELIGQRDTARAYTASALGNGTHGSERPPSPDQGRPNPDEGRRSGPRLFGRRPAPRQPAATAPEPPPGQRAPDVPAGAPAPDVPAGAPAPAENDSPEVSQP